eukprot:TRINITY_DN26266_c0_g1_i1.p1 TRINITY_DN26266_c0_g1~~TRINITY_DN26266_c0_g1_i1.p1  ORF type:complete len:514 (+),score=64.04 TRINITY_DN26266_c0_g1_i1:131-1672(+)
MLGFKRRNFLIGCAAVALAGYGTYRVYRSSYIAQTFRQIQSLLNTLSNIADAAEEGISCSKVLCADLHAFLLSDKDEVPQSLKQLLKLGRSDDVRATLMTMTTAFSHGILTTALQCSGSLEGCQRLRINGAESLDGRIPERLLGKLFSPAGTGFASAVVGSATRNLIMGIIEYNQKRRTRRTQLVAPLSPRCRFDTSPEVTSDGEDGDFEQSWSPVVSSVMDFACSTKGRPLISECIEIFVATAVTAYLDKTKDVNVYDDLVAGMTRPEHQGPVKDMLTSVCSTAVQALVRTSHEVFSVDSPDPPETDQSPFDSDSVPLERNCLLGNTSMKSKAGRYKHTFLKNLSSPKSAEMSDQSTSWSTVTVKRRSGPVECSPSEESCLQSNHGAETPKGVLKQVPGTLSWATRLSRALAVPRNRKLVVDVAGIVSAEAVRSFCEAIIGVCSAVLSGKYGTLAGNSDQQFTHLLRDSFVGRLVLFEQHVGRSARLAASRSLVVMTVCLVICLHCMVGVGR